MMYLILFLYYESQSGYKDTPFSYIPYSYIYFVPLLVVGMIFNIIYLLHDEQYLCNKNENQVGSFISFNSLHSFHVTFM